MQKSPYTQSLSAPPAKYDCFIAQIKRFDPYLDLQFCSTDFSYHITHIDDHGTVYPIKIVPMISADSINAEDFIASINKFDYWNKPAALLMDEIDKEGLDRHRKSTKSGLDHSGLREGLKRRAGLRINNAGIPAKGAAR